eukprot:scaffold22195_cov38-Prasinocladus_malaysianus.AAC.1
MHSLLSVGRDGRQALQKFWGQWAADRALGYLQHPANFVSALLFPAISAYLGVVTITAPLQLEALAMKC